MALIREGLLAARGGNPYAVLAAAAVRRRLGPRATAAEVARACQLIGTSLRPGTGDNYRSWLQRYLRFCDRTGEWPVPASAATIYRYLVEASGELAASSLGRYLTAVVGLHRDLGYEPPIGPSDPFIARLLRGRVAERGEGTGPRAVGPTIPAAAVWEVLCRASTDADLARLRAGVAVVTTFISYQRSDSTLSLGPDDVAVLRHPPPASLACQICGSPDRPDTMVLCDRCDSGSHLDCINLPGLPAGRWECAACSARGAMPTCAYDSRVLSLRFTHRKGHTHTGEAIYRQYSLRGCPDVADLVERFAAEAERAWAATPQRRRRFFFELPQDPQYWRPSDRLSQWLAESLTAAAWPGDYPSHSLRRGAASAARAAGVPTSVIEALGLWAPGSRALQQRYFDPAVRPSPAGRAFSSFHSL